MAPKGTRKGSQSAPTDALFSGPNRNSARYKRAERMVANGEASSTKEALSAIYRKELEGRNAKAKRDGFENGYTKKGGKRSFIEDTERAYKAQLSDLLGGKKAIGDPEIISAIWQLFRAKYQVQTGVK